MWFKSGRTTQCCTTSCSSTGEAAMIRGLNRFLRAKKGAALVEFSLLAPVLIMLMCGMCEFANAMRQYHIMEKGVRDAGRYLARVPMTGCTVNGSAITAARNLALTGQVSGGTN